MNVSCFLQDGDVSRKWVWPPYKLNLSQSISIHVCFCTVHNDFFYPPSLPSLSVQPLSLPRSLSLLLFIPFPYPFPPTCLPPLHSS